MNLRDRFMEWLLAAFDRFQDWRSHGRWTMVRGSEIPNIVKVKDS